MIRHLEADADALIERVVPRFQPPRQDLDNPAEPPVLASQHALSRALSALEGTGRQSPGMDFGTFVATYEDGKVVMRGDAPGEQQQVIFSDVTDESFE